MRAAPLLLTLALVTATGCNSPGEVLQDFDGDGSLDADDCGPDDSTIHPGAPDCLGDSIDQDCDGSDGVDGDADGYPRSSPDPTCPGGGDCNDGDPAIHPGASEVAEDGIDNDCDGGDLVCDADGDGALAQACGGADCDDFSSTCTALCEDRDGDGFRGCDGDCNDDDPDLHEGSAELCNGIDDDCNAYLPPDEADFDGDGVMQCEGDCNDLDLTVSPQLPEACDDAGNPGGGVDNDCDGSSDDELQDSDGDGFPPCSYYDAQGVWVVGDDCDDTDPLNFTGGVESCDGQDNDCNIATDENIDGDGDGETVCAGDCDEGNPTVWTGGTEVCDVDDLDQDCDGLVDQNDPDAAGCVWESVATYNGWHGERFACGIRADASMECWGNTYNIDGPSFPGQQFVPAPSSGSYQQLALSQGHMCGLTTSGQVDCWGSSSSGQCDPPTANFSEIHGGRIETCGLTVAGEIECWGVTFDEATDPDIPYPPTGQFTTLAMSNNHACVITANQSIQCWGFNYSGESDPPAGSFTAVSVADQTSCALTNQGALTCWGGGLGAAWFNTFSGVQFTQISQGNRVGCGLDQVGGLHCWGDLFNQTPSGTFIQVSAAEDYACAVTTANTIECWGTCSSDGECNPP